MEDKSSYFLKLLANRYHAAGQDSFLRPLPAERLKSVANVGIDATDPLPAISQSIALVEKIHYSWLIPKIKELPKSKILLLLSLLPPNKKSKLRAALSVSEDIPQTSAAMKTFLAPHLIPLIQFENRIPLEYLPKGPLSSLGILHKKQLIELIDLLGLYDLGQEIHHIVDKKILEQVYKCLSLNKNAYLKKCLHAKERLVTQRINLEHWDGQCEKLSKLLHHRGMVRLGYALSGLNPGLIWHIVHTLDSGRGEKLQRLISDKEISGVSPTIRKHVQNTLEFMQKGGKS